jgi:MerR family transcriptional regulator, light-induced transcriptional regulator
MGLAEIRGRRSPRLYWGGDLMSVGSFTEELSVDGCWEMVEPEAFTRVADSHVMQDSVVTDAELRKARLMRTVEGEIIPRLILAGRAARQEAAPTYLQTAPTAEDVAELTRLLLQHDGAVAMAYVESVRQRGMGLETICLELLAPTARQLGVLWEEDRCTFMQVTVALCRLHGVLRELNPAFRTPGLPDSRDHGRRVLLMPTPGEQHTFGLLMVGEFMRRAGWEVWTDFPGTQKELTGMVAGHWFAVAGLSLGSEARLEQMTSAIKALRRESRNPSIGIMVGGPIFVSHPEYVARVGADVTAVDARQATERADSVFDLLSAVN